MNIRVKISFCDIKKFIFFGMGYGFILFKYYKMVNNFYNFNFLKCIFMFYKIIFDLYLVICLNKLFCYKY